MKKQIILGLDDGHSYIKVCGSPDKTGKLQKIIFPSIAYSGAIFQGEQALEHVIKVKDDTYTVGITTSAEQALDTRTLEYPTSGYNKALIYQAIRKYCEAIGIKDKDICNYEFKILTSLPVSRYYQSSGKNNDLIQKKKEFLLNEEDCYRVSDNIRLAITDHIVLCEAQVAFFNKIIDQHGNPTEDEEILTSNECCVIDIGGKTTDIVLVVQGGNIISKDKSKSQDLGILDIFDDIENLIKSKKNISKVNKAWLTQATNKGKKYGQYGIGDKAIDISDIIKTAKKEFVIKLKNLITKTIGSGDDLAMIVFCGGGAEFLREEINEIMGEQAFIDDEAQFSNAKGLWKLGTYMFFTGE